MLNKICNNLRNVANNFLCLPVVSSLLLISCQTTTPITALPTPRFQGVVSWYPDSIQITYQPMKSTLMKTDFSMEAQANTETLSLTQSQINDLSCEKFGGDLLCNINVISMLETRNGKNDYLDPKGRLKVEFISDKYGHTRAAKFVAHPAINPEFVSRFDDAMQSMIGRLLNEYPQSGLRVGDRIVFGQNKKYTGLDGKEFTAELEATVKGKSIYNGRDVIVLDMKGNYRQHPIDAEMKGYGVVDISTGLMTVSDMQSYINERGVTARIRITNSTN